MVIAMIALAAAARPIARVANVDVGRVSDLMWEGAVVFVLVGRAATLVLLDPRLLLDPLVAIRFADELAIGPGVIAALVWTWWRHRGAHASVAVAAVGLSMIVALIVFDLACPLRGTCGGRVSALPIAFAQDGLAAPRLPAAPIEAILLLPILAAYVRLADRTTRLRSACALLASAALVHFAIVPTLLLA